MNTANISKLAENLQVDGEALIEEIKRLLPDRAILDEEYADLAARTAASHNLEHHHYGLLGGRILSTYIQSITKPTFSEAAEHLRSHEDDHGASPLINEDVYDFIIRNREAIDSAIRPERDFDLTFFSLRTLTRAYLLKSAKTSKPIETPQYMFMRVAIGICKSSLSDAIQIYNDMSQRLYVHATPTLFNAATNRQQCSSCFLLTVKDDSLQGIFDTFTQISNISKFGGGIGLSVSNVRGKGSRIRSTNGTSNGLVPMLRVLNNISLYVDQCGKRKGSIAVYLEPWHSDTLDFLDLRLPVGSEELRTRDLFLALWVPDLFMERVRDGKKWSLMCPDECPGLQDAHSEEFRELYESYEAAGKYKRQVDAQDVWMRILTSQTESGQPYICFKDAVNRKNAQKNLGTIRSSNLCTEVVLFSSPEEVAVCNLASLCLPQYVGAEDGAFDFELLEKKVRQVTRNLNNVIDVNYYPVEEARNSNQRHRPIGIGVQGLADALQKMKMAYESDEAKKMDAEIFEVIYFAALDESCELAKVHGPYSSFEGSPASEGVLQFDMWERTQQVYSEGRIGEERWEALKAKIKTHGLRNSCLISPMPTASTAQIMGSYAQAFHPINSVIMQRRTLAGDYLLICPTFVDDMIGAEAWTPEVREKLILASGRVDDPLVSGLIPDHIRKNYTSVWDMKQRHVVQHAVHRGCFVDQTQSMELWLAEPTTKVLTNMHFFSWRNGLKTGIYYLRGQSKAKSIQFSVGEPSSSAGQPPAEEDECLNCGS